MGGVGLFLRGKGGQAIAQTPGGAAEGCGQRGRSLSFGGSLIIAVNKTRPLGDSPASRHLVEAVTVHGLVRIERLRQTI